MTVRILSVLVLIAALGGCGGGGSGGSGVGSGPGTPARPETPAGKDSFSMEVSESSISMGEGESTEFSVSIAGNTSVSITAESLSPLVVAETDGNKVVISALEVGNKVTTSVVVTARSLVGTHQESRRIEVVITDTSGQKVIDQIAALALSSGRFELMPEEESVFEFLVDAGYLVGSFNKAKVAILRNSFAELLSVGRDGFASALSETENIIKEYEGGRLAEDSLILHHKALVSLVDARGRLFFDAINNLILQMDAGSPLPHHGFAFIEHAGEYSQFVGNPSLGRYVAGDWRFDSQYAYLMPLVERASGQCPALN